MNEKEIELMVDAGHMIAPRHLFLNLSKQEQAYLVITRIAANYSIEAFECEGPTGDIDCIFCGWLDPCSEGNDRHAEDCLAVLIQEFK